MACTHARDTRPLALTADLTIYTATDTRARLFPACAEPAITEIDMASVAELDTSGVQLLLLACKTAMASGGALRLLNVQPAVQETFDLLRLGPVFEAAASSCAACARERRAHGLV